MPIRARLLHTARRALARPGSAGLLLLALLGWPGAAAWAAPPGPAADWPARLQAALATLEAASPLQFGVYVRDLDSGVAAGHRADELWYLASTVKLPVALAVLRDVQHGAYDLDTRLTLRADDYVDGAGSTNRHPVGTSLTVRELLEQMMVWSDNTASDMLIGLTGLDQVNRLVQDTTQAAVPAGFRPITTLADVRREVYGQLTPAARSLSGRDFLLLRAQPGEAERLQVLARRLGVPAGEFRLPGLRPAYDAYYAGGLNSARLDAYGELLTRFARGEVLDDRRTRWLLALMERSRTGPQRVRAGLPKGVRFAHKTGTQRERTCDSGVITVPRLGRDQRIVLAACTRGEPSLAAAERALRGIGTALCRSGLLDQGTRHDTVCPDDLPALPLAPPRGAAGPRP
ncbi:serine hydrolase [Aquabacterium sp. J223]|uniref:serine hydrolase n=1 Tax=Aquabacterium sp. J223 TaxID=2898431 RepID=UPI0021ADBC50|nr:serine hydrolase [Aquabacterium sp. J223]UUX96338.1 class A beta-lactamase-related serine hydrolase [Aquabacterium sp. J223]